MNTNPDELAKQIHRLEKQLNQFDDESQSIINEEIDRLRDMYTTIIWRVR